MDWTKRWRKRLRAILRKASVDRDVDDDVELRLDVEPREDLRPGMSPRARDNRRPGWLTGVSLDFRLGRRMLRKHLALTLIGGLGLAVGVAIAAGFFTFMTGFYYSHPPLEEGERIVAIENQNLTNSEDWRASLYDFHAWGESLRSVRELAAFRRTSHGVQVPGGLSGREQVAEMTASGFRVARVPPLLGRPLLDADEVQGAAPVVVIGHNEWRRYFAADPEVIGRDVRLGGTTYEVVGVMPEGFRFPLNHGFWTALETNASRDGPGEGPRIFVFGRLGPGVSEADAQAELDGIGERLSTDLPAVYEHLRPAILPYVHPFLDVQQYPAWVVWAMQLFGILVLTVVAVNVAVLVYARTAARRTEITVRTALGAGRRRIVTQLFLEALTLSSGAAALGLLLAEIGYRELLGSINTDFLPYWLVENGLPGATIPWAGGLAVLVAVLVGVLPAVRVTDRHLQTTLRRTGGGPDMRMGSTWTALIVGQVAIAVAVLPVVVGMFVNTVLEPVPTPTFPAEEILTFRLDRDRDAFEGARPELESALASRQQELIRRIAAEPGVSGVTYATDLPRSGERVRIEADPPLATSEPIPTFANSVERGYFDVLDVPLLAGRHFEPDDLLDDARAVIVNRAFVQRLLGGGETLGRRVREMAGIGRDTGGDEPWYEIVGIVENMYERPDRAQPVMYHPVTAGPELLWIAARTRGAAPADVLPRVREIAGQVAPGRRLSARTMDALYAGPTQEAKRLMTLIVGLVTLSVLLLSAAGISALMSFAVTRRHREIGVRIAMGAPRRRIVTAIFRRSARQLALGLVVGITVGGVLDRLTGGELLGGRAGVLLPLVATMMVVAGLLATLRPARRALRIHPMEAMRAE